MLSRQASPFERATYANFTFFTPILVGRTLMKVTGIKPESENNVNVSALNGFFGKLFECRMFLAQNLRLPFRRLNRSDRKKALIQVCDIHSASRCTK